MTQIANNFGTAATFDGISNGGKTIAFTIPDQLLSAGTQSASFALTVVDQGSVPVLATLALIALGLLGFPPRSARKRI